MKIDFLTRKAFDPDQPRDDAGKWTAADQSAAINAAALSPADRRVLSEITRRASGPATSIRIAALAATTGVTPPVLWKALERAVTAGTVQSVSESGGEFHIAFADPALANLGGVRKSLSPTSHGRTFVVAPTDQAAQDAADAAANAARPSPWWYVRVRAGGTGLDTTTDRTRSLGVKSARTRKSAATRAEAASELAGVVLSSGGDFSDKRRTFGMVSPKRRTL